MCSAEEIDLREKLYVTLQNAGFHLNKVFGPSSARSIQLTAL